MFNTSKYDISSYAKQLCSDIRYVRANNMLGNMNTYIQIVKGKGSYILMDKGIKIKEIYPPSSVKTSWYSDKIRFKRDGIPNPTGGTIKIMNKKYNNEITVVPVSGRVLLKEGKYEK